MAHHVHSLAVHIALHGTSIDGDRRYSLCQNPSGACVKYGELSGHELEHDQVDYGIESTIFAKGPGIVRLIALI